MQNFWYLSNGTEFLMLWSGSLQLSKQLQGEAV